MKIRGLFSIGFCMVLLLLASCQSALDLSSGSAKNGGQIDTLIVQQGKSNLDELSGTFPADEGTATPQVSSETPESATQDDMTSTPLPTPIATFTPTPVAPMFTPSPTAMPTQLPEPCYAAPVDETANLQVYAGPAYSHPVIGTAQPRQYYVATGALPQDMLGQGPGIQIDFNGVPGWVDASNYMFKGNCWPIPTLAAWPTPIVTSTPSPFPTPYPTSTLSPDINPSQLVDISSVIGSTAQITRALPTADGRTTTVTAIRVNFAPSEVGPYDGIRMLNILVQCTGVNPQNLRWGYYGSETRFECGRYIDTGVSQGWNIVDLALAVPSDGMTAATYTITVTVNAP